GIFSGSLVRGRCVSADGGSSSSSVVAGIFPESSPAPLGRFRHLPGIFRVFAAAGSERSAAAAVGRDALVGEPDAVRRLAGLPEYVDWDAAARVPIAADAQVARRKQRDEALADCDRAVLVERAVAAEARQVELQRFRFH